MLMSRNSSLAAVAAMFGVPSHVFNMRHAPAPYRKGPRLGPYFPRYGRAREPVPEHIQAQIVLFALVKRERRCAKRGGRPIIDARYWRQVRL